MAFPCFNWPTPGSSLAFHRTQLNCRTVPISRCGLRRTGPLTIIAALLPPRQRHAGGRVQCLLRSRGAAIVLGAALDTTVVPREPCPIHGLSGAEIDRMFAPVADSDYMTFAQALVQRDRNGHVRASTGDCFFFIDPFAAAVVVEPVIMTGRCMPPWRSPWHRASPAARRSLIRRDGSGRPLSRSSRKLDSIDLPHSTRASLTYVPRRRR